EICGTDLEFAIVARCDCRVRREIDCRGHDETRVIVGVLADKIDAPWCAKGDQSPLLLPDTDLKRGSDDFRQSFAFALRCSPCLLFWCLFSMIQGMVGNNDFACAGKAPAAGPDAVAAFDCHRQDWDACFPSETHGAGFESFESAFGSCAAAFGEYHDCYAFAQPLKRTADRRWIAAF